MQMPARIDVVGHKYGRLTVISNNAHVPNKRRTVKCVCDCGNIVSAEPKVLRIGEKKSCGCLQRDNVRRAATFIKSRGVKEPSPEYVCWCNIKSRCNNKNNRAYKNYGGRGIYVCPRWVNSFANFKKDMGPKPSPNHSIDRIDNDGPYSPENCRWATSHQQSRNRSDNRIVTTADGQKMCLVDACKNDGIPYNTAQWRISIGREWNDVRRPTHAMLPPSPPKLEQT